MDIFDIIGPVMIGPSSSHTAGAARIGRVARRLLGETPARADIALAGSFAGTGRGHGTDRAILAGLMDMGVDDPRIRDSLEIARVSGMEYAFTNIELANAHPNTAILRLTGRGGESLDVRAASVGGGAIRVEELNGLKVDFSGAANTVVISHTDEPGIIANVSGLIAAQKINIATMQVFRRFPGGEAVMVIETDEIPGADVMRMLKALPGIHTARMLEKI